jgi:LysM repeat protein
VRAPVGDGHSPAHPCHAYHSGMSGRGGGSGIAGLVGFLLALALVAVIGALAFAFGVLPPQVAGPGVAPTSSPGVQQTDEPLASPTADAPSPGATVEPSPTGAPVGTLLPTPGGTHVVQPGEALFTIAEKYGVTIQAIVDANQIQNPDHIEAGQVLIIPIPVPATAGAESYIVQADDNMTSIALQFGVTPSDLADFNNIPNWDDIKVGQVLYIPGPGWTPRPIED